MDDADGLVEFIITELYKVVVASDFKTLEEEYS